MSIRFIFVSVFIKVFSAVKWRRVSHTCDTSDAWSIKCHSTHFLIQAINLQQWQVMCQKGREDN